MFDQHRAAAEQANSQYARQQPSQPSDRTLRTLRALIYAAKADGHIDDDEQAAIDDQIDQLNLGDEARAAVNQIMRENVDPNKIAAGLADAREAMQIYAMSASVINPDQFMEKSYLDSLAKALRLPDNVVAAINQRLGR